MLNIELTIPTKNLPIRRVLSKLFQSYVYRVLDDKEHQGYRHPSGKVFKSMNFNINYKDNKIYIKYSALDKNNEKLIALDIINSGLKLGNIHISNTSIKLEDRNKFIKSSMIVGGFICANIKDSNSNKKIYLEPKTNKFQEIIYKNTLQKYEALYKKDYKDSFDIKLLKQKPNFKKFYYSKGIIKAWYGIYKISGNKEILEMILNTGMGSDAMKGVGFIDILKEYNG